MLSMQSVDNSQLISEYYSCLNWAHVLIRHYLTAGMKYAPTKEYVLNKHVRL